MADVYDYLGNLKEKRNTLIKLIDAANKENNTWLVEVGLENLGKTYIEGDRNFKLADSLFRKCIEIAVNK